VKAVLKHGAFWHVCDDERLIFEQYEPASDLLGTVFEMLPGIYRSLVFEKKPGDPQLVGNWWQERTPGCLFNSEDEARQHVLSEIAGPTLTPARRVESQQMTDAIAQALVLAVDYIAKRPQECDTLDDDCKQLEIAASLVQEATQSEKEALIRAAIELGLPEWPKQIGIVDDDDDD
jgi:hypothetical protein